MVGVIAKYKYAAGASPFGLGTGGGAAGKRQSGYHSPVASSCLSAFEHEIEFRGIVPQLAELFGANRTMLWFAGHEHRLAVYGYNSLTEAAGFYLRCIGHGGMPVEVDKSVPRSADPAAPENRNLILYDKRVRERIEGNIALGIMGMRSCN